MTNTTFAQTATRNATVINQRPAWRAERFERYFSAFDSTWVADANNRSQLQRLNFANCTLLHVTGNAHDLRRTQVDENDEVGASFTAFLLLSGHACVTQGGRQADLGAGQITLIDGQMPFKVDMQTPYKKLLLQLPRKHVLTRHAELSTLTALTFDSDRGANLMYKNLVTSIDESVHHLQADRCHALMTTCIEMLALLSPEFQAGPNYDRSQLVRDRAVAHIDANLDNVDLTPVDVAQAVGVSRRRLDVLFESAQTTVAKQIWSRRLSAAARQLRFDYAGRSVPRIIDVALDAGFKDPAHFSRAFREKFGRSPRQYRMGQH